MCVLPVVFRIWCVGSHDAAGGVVPVLFTVPGVVRVP